MSTRTSYITIRATRDEDGLIVKDLNSFYSGIIIPVSQLRELGSHEEIIAYVLSSLPSDDEDDKVTAYEVSITSQAQKIIRKIRAKI